MSKEYNLFCFRHGHIKIEVEKPPIKFHAAPMCPFCLSNLVRPDKDTEKKWQSNLVGEGANA